MLLSEEAINAAASAAMVILQKWEVTHRAVNGAWARSHDYGGGDDKTTLMFMRVARTPEMKSFVKITINEVS